MRGVLGALVVACGAGLACGKGSPLPPPPAGGEETFDSGTTVTHDASGEGADGATPPRDASVVDAGLPERTLFVGNSFTYTNNLPGMYGALAAPVAPGQVAPMVASVAYGAYTLTQHLADAQGTGPNPQLATLLGTGDAGHVRWSHVLLQEQSQIPGFALSNAQRMSSMSSTVSLSGYVAATGATTVLLMTWGYAKGDPTNPTIFPDYPTMQSLLTTGYEQMAQAVATAGHAVKVAPAGLAFQAVYQREKTMGQDPLASGSLFLQLYGPDFIHPAVPGTFLAACVVTATIYGVDPTTLTGSVAGIDAATQLVLETAARDAVAAQNAMPAP